jgi:predicted phage terminase large subunit-like protein
VTRPSQQRLPPTPEDFAFSRLIAYAAFQWPGYEAAKHHRLIARHLEAVERGDIRRLMISMPPRHGKSMLASEFFPAWYLGRNPSHYVIAATYAQDLADDFGRKVRDQIAESTFQAVFPGCQLKGDSKSSKRFHVTHESEDPQDAFATDLDGAYFAAGICGPLTGRGAHLLLIDDPVKNREDAESSTLRQKAKDWYTSTAYTRLMPDGKIVIIQTRWHEDDLTGWQLKEHAHEGWVVLSLPALAETDDDILGRKTGEPLWGHYPLQALERIKRSIGSRDWTALYQQRPAPAEGGIFKAEWFRRYGKQQDAYQQIVQSWDTAVKADEINDPSVCTTWGIRPDGYDLLQVLVRRLEYPDLKRLVKSQAEAFGADAVLIEDKASGQQLLQDLKRSTKLPLIGINPEKDKITRASAVSAIVEAGKVALPQHAAWLTDYETEMLTFPNAPHDDQVDSTTQFLGWARDKSYGGVARIRTL